MTTRVAKKAGRPKGSKNKTLEIPKFLKRNTSPVEVEQQKGRFVLEQINDDVSMYLFRELQVELYYIKDTDDGPHGRYIGRIFDERFAKLIVEFLNGKKRVPKRLREQLKEELCTTTE